MVIKQFDARRAAIILRHRPRAAAPTDRRHNAIVPGTAGRRIVSMLGVIAVMFGLVTVMAAPARADAPLSAEERCEQNATPDMSETAVHNGNQVGASFPEGTDPPNAIFPGDVVRVTVTGGVSIDPWGNSVGPDGNGVAAPDSSWPFAGMSQFSSIANWNNNPGGWVGSPMQTTSLARCTPAPSDFPVRLLFYLNDGVLSDNGGSWKIHTEVYRATPTVAIDGVQVTQGIQTKDNAVPLIAGKRTFVRVFVRNTDRFAGPVFDVGASLTVDGESRTYEPLLAPTVTATGGGGDPGTLSDSFLFELDKAAIGTGRRYLSVTVTPPGGMPAHRLLLVDFQDGGPARDLQVFGARYSYWNIPPAMQQQIGVPNSLWPARPIVAWESMRATAENALPVAHLTINEIAPTSSWGSVFFDCRAVQDPTGTWGCGGYVDARPWAEGQVDSRCPGGGCWIVVLQPEIDTTGHHGAHYVDGRGNHVINLQGESSPIEQGLTMAHEIGHGLGLPHTWDDPTYPRADGGLGPFVGLRSTPAFSLVPGESQTGQTAAFDLMSYQGPAWFSPHNYCRALADSSAGRITCPSGLTG